MLTIILIVTILIIFGYFWYMCQKPYTVQCEKVKKELKDFYADYPQEDIHIERVYLLVESAKDFLDSLSKCGRYQSFAIRHYKSVLTKRFHRLKKFGFESEYWRF